MQTMKCLPGDTLAHHTGECGDVTGLARLFSHTHARRPDRRHRRISSSARIALLAVTGAFFAHAAPATEPGGEPYASGSFVNAQVSLQPGDSMTDTLRSGGAGPEMVLIPGGSFRMGCVSGVNCQDREMPVREVSVGQPFALSKNEVTLASFRRFVEATGHVMGESCWTQEHGHYREHSGRDWRDPGFRQTGRHPVTCVSWNDAKAYVNWLSAETGQQYRLPSEAEWEYAARAGSSSAYSWGNTVRRKRANCANCRTRWDGDKTSPAGSFPANAFGVHDMHGNVWEWVQDCSSRNYEGAPGDASARLGNDCSGHVLRGGSWSNLPKHLRSANRSWLAAENRSFNLGFRVARDVTPATLMGELNRE